MRLWPGLVAALVSTCSSCCVVAVSNLWALGGDRWATWATWATGDACLAPESLGWCSPIPPTHHTQMKNGATHPSSWPHDHSLKAPVLGSGRGGPQAEAEPVKRNRCIPPVPDASRPIKIIESALYSSSQLFCLFHADYSSSSTTSSMIS